MIRDFLRIVSGLVMVTLKGFFIAAGVIAAMMLSTLVSEILERQLK